MRTFGTSARLLGVASSLALLAACEDGPTQTFSPSPDGAASAWNNGNTPPAVGDAGAPFQEQQGGSTQLERCTGPQLAARWAVMVKEPITPPTKAAGIDISGGSTWKGLTIEDAEKINCQSTVYGDLFGDGNLDNFWGDNAEVTVEYSVATRKIVQMNIWPGYLGTMDFQSRDGSHKYSIGIQTRVQKDGQPYTLDWTGNGGKNFIPAADELYRALIATYSGLPEPPDTETCFDSGHCIKGSFGDVAYWYVPLLGVAFWIDNQNAPQPTPSTFTRLDLNIAKVLPFSLAPPLLKLDAEGPTASAGNLGHNTSPCVLKLGETFGDFKKECVQVTGDQTKDTDELNKLVGGISHGDETFSFDVTGVDINFKATTLGPTDIVKDNVLPADADVARSLKVDQSTLGKIANDWTSDLQTQDLHGTGAVYKEFARLVRTNLLALSNIPDGDPSKCLSTKGGQPLPSNLPAYCTGLEGFITPAPSTGAGDVTNVGAAQAIKLLKGFRLGLKLGHQSVLICDDANGDFVKGYQSCVHGDTFSTVAARVLSVFGHGKLSNLPTAVQDYRFYFRQWVTAYLKYLQVAAQNPVPDLATQTINTDDIFFDSLGAGQFEMAEYVDRRFASPTQPPTDITVYVDVKDGIFDEYNFSRALYRGESAIYTAIRVNPNDGLGQEENALLTNVFGSPVLKSGWKNSTAGKSAYYCATTLDPTNCDQQTPPLDADGNVLLDDHGRPVLAPYPGAFTSTPFSLGTTKVRVTQTFNDTQQAMIHIPLRANPYDAKSAALNPLDIMVPWAPKQPGVGFPIAINGDQDKFVMSSQMDLSGTTITANIDYDLVLDPNTHLPTKDNAIQLLAVETTDFLGDVFLCQDSATGDLLSARMYTPTKDILDWIGKHPSAYNDCQLIVRYSPFNNYPDYITSLTAGVRLGITQGGGFGRVVDVTLFVPGQ